MDVGAGAYLVVVIGFAVIGGGSGSGGSWGWRGEGEDMFGGGAVLEYIAEDIQHVSGPCWWRWGRRRALIVVSTECRWMRRGCRVSESCRADCSFGVWWQGCPDWWRVSICTVCACGEAVLCTGVGWVGRLFTVCIGRVLLFTIETGLIWLFTVCT